MTTLILTLVGSDRPGLAGIVDEHGGNWENSRLAELAGTFAGVVQVSVPIERVEELRDSLHGLDGLMSIVVHPGSDPARPADEPRHLSVQVLGNDRPGIVREISGVLKTHALSIESMTSQTRDAAMAGGRLFEAAVVATIPASADPDALRADLERIANDLQVDITVG
jgi:glycine cleavage system regulatory protein